MDTDKYYKEITTEEFNKYQPLNNFHKNMYVQGGKYADLLRKQLGCDTLLPVAKTLKIMDNYNYLCVWSYIKDETGLYLSSSRNITTSKGYVVCACPYQKKDIGLLRYYIQESTPKSLRL